jgi:hypothetical protein
MSMGNKQNLLDCWLAILLEIYDDFRCREGFLCHLLLIFDVVVKCITRTVIKIENLIFSLLQFKHRLSSLESCKNQDVTAGNMLS